jgi:quercetin dioxygenase-like cupin family protein
MRHDDALYDDLAALAVGALSAAEAQALEEHLAACARCRAEYAAAREGFDVALAATESAGSRPSTSRAEALRDRVMASARAARAPAGKGYSAVVARDALIPFGPGIQWAVVPQQGITMIYWVFDPPECGELPPETHTQTQAGYVLEGEIDLHYYDEGRTMALKQGAFYTIAPGTVHAATFPTRTVLLDTYAPNHTEFERRYREDAALRAQHGSSRNGG